MVVIGKNILNESYPTFIIAELGINHNGDQRTLMEMVRQAHAAGADAVKIQMRTPEICVPRDQWDIMRDTPWGRISYIDYRNKIELGYEEIQHFIKVAKEVGIIPMASVWDAEAFNRYLRWFDGPPVTKIPSACITDHVLLQLISRYENENDTAVIMSNGGSSLEQMSAAVRTYPWDQLVLMHTTSIYPCPDEQINLRGMYWLKDTFPKYTVGFSNHSPGIIHCATAVAMGADAVEAHFTLDRTMWGTDQAASFEPGGFARMVKYVRATEKAIGKFANITYEGETKTMEKLRRVR